MISTAIHSHKGGVGKTTLCVNMAFFLANKGYNVGLLDNDYQGPNLYTYFKEEPSFFINDYINQKAEPEEFLINISESYDLKGKLVVGLADPSPDATRSSMKLNQQMATNILRKQLRLKSELSKKSFNVDFLILDTTPGIGMNSINSFLCADNIVFLIKMSNSDITGTAYMIDAVLDTLYHRTMLVANQIPSKRITDQNQRSKLENLILTTFKNSSGVKDIEFIGWVPSDPDLQLIEFDGAVSELEGNETERMIHTLKLPQHPFTDAVKEICNNIYGDVLKF